jgi:hypothetical protein
MLALRNTVLTVKAWPLTVSARGCWLLSGVD